MHLHLLTLFFYLLQIKAEPCITSDGKQGECVFIDDCPVLANLFANPINGAEELLKKYKCSVAYTVCCISGWNSTNYGKGLSDRRYCGYQHTDDYFPTGNATSLDEFPWLAAIVETDPDSGKDKIVCLGSLINNRYILTLARCANYALVTHFRIKVQLGKYHAKNTTSCIDHENYGNECTEVQEFGIEEKILHPFYDRLHGLHNIGLIRLTKTTSYTDYIRPICLPTQGTKVAEVGDILYTTGWGTVDFFNTTVKEKVKSIITTSEECQKYYEDRRVSATNHICTRALENNTKLSCSFDNGAPVMFSYKNQWQIEGISVVEMHCSTYIKLHTRVSTYIDWIKQRIRP